MYVYFKDNELEQDLTFIPSPKRSSKVNNNRYYIFSTPQTEQFGTERCSIFNFIVFLNQIRVDKWRKIKRYKY